MGLLVVTLKSVSQGLDGDELRKRGLEELECEAKAIKLATTARTSSVMSVPIVDGLNVVLGVFTVINKLGGLAFSTGE